MLPGDIKLLNMGLVKKTYKKVFWIVFLITLAVIFIIVVLNSLNVITNIVWQYHTLGRVGGLSPYYDLTPTAIKTGTLNRDETWSGVILIEDDVIVPKGKTLTIKPGTIVKFTSNGEWGDFIEWGSNITNLLREGRDVSIVSNYKNYPMSKLIIYGNLISEGDPDNLIVFTSNEKYPEGGDWFGILFEQDCFTTKQSKISYSIVEYGFKNIVPDYSDEEEYCEGNPLTIENSIIRHANKIVTCEELEGSMPFPSGANSDYLRASGIEILGYPTIIRGNIIYDNFNGVTYDFPLTIEAALIIENNIIAFHDKHCWVGTPWGWPPGLGIRISGGWVEAGLEIRNNLFFKNYWGVEIDNFALIEVKNNIFLSNQEGIPIFNWEEFPEQTFSYNNFYGNREDRTASMGAGGMKQPLEDTETSIDPMFSEQDFWNADFTIKNPELKNVGPNWDWSWVKPDILTKK